MEQRDDFHVLIGAKIAEWRDGFRPPRSWTSRRAT